jgi:glyoxylase-like metal-dependent hydrolase (beta-lactamase superfamily II)
VTINDTGDGRRIASREIGNAKVTVVSDGVLWWAPQFPVPDATRRSAMPEADAEGRVPLGLNIVLIAIGSARVVVDPAFDTPRPDGDQSGWGSALERTPGLDDALVAIGWDAAAVTHVVVTHPHGDHIGGLTRGHTGRLEPRFPNARHYLGRADWDDREAVLEFRRPIREVARAGLLDLVEGELEIASGVTLIPAPGETPGHQVVRLESEGESVWILGDLIHHGCEVAHPDWAAPHADASTVHATRLAIFPILARTGVLVIVPHVPFPGWGHIVEDGSDFRFVPAGD